jgi:hypothetical protein
MAPQVDSECAGPGIGGAAIRPAGEKEFEEAGMQVEAAFLL